MSAGVSALIVAASRTGAILIERYWPQPAPAERLALLETLHAAAASALEQTREEEEHVTLHACVWRASAW